MSYDSRKDTIVHIKHVQELGSEVIKDLNDRFVNHDKTMLWPPEKPIYDKCMPLLNEAETSEEERSKLEALFQPAKDHHFLNNRHHIEHFEEGVKGMNLMDILETLCDWKAECHDFYLDDMVKLISNKKKEYKFTKELEAILLNTIKDLGW